MEMLMAKAAQSVRRVPSSVGRKCSKGLGLKPRLQNPRYQDFTAQTPLLDLTHMVSSMVPGVHLYAKAEFMNTGFSHKDRIAEHILTKALDRGELKPGDTVVVASSGNTAASIAWYSHQLGCRCVVLTNDKCSQEKVSAIQLYGAEVHIVPDGVCYMAEETRLANENPDWFSVNQYDNLDNPEAHYYTLGPEIWAQTEGRITDFVMAVSTGGTISGVGKFLKEKNPDVQVTCADPKGSIVAEYIRSGKITDGSAYLVEGAGKNEIPGAFDKDVVDHAIEIKCEESFRTCHKLAKQESLCVGGSSGLNVAAALKVANKAREPRVIVTILCDSGLKYLSKVYNPDYLKRVNIEADL